MQALALHDTLRQLRQRTAAQQHSAELIEWAAAQAPRIAFDGQALTISMKIAPMSKGLVGARLTATECIYYLGNHPRNLSIDTRHAVASAWRCVDNDEITSLRHPEVNVDGESILYLPIVASTLYVTLWTPRNGYICQPCPAVLIDRLRQPMLAFARAVGALE
jgi:hypothetical protein